MPEERQDDPTDPRKARTYTLVDAGVLGMLRTGFIRGWNLCARLQGQPPSPFAVERLLRDVKRELDEAIDAAAKGERPAPRVERPALIVDPTGRPLVQ